MAEILSKFLLQQQNIMCPRDFLKLLKKKARDPRDSFLQKQNTRGLRDSFKLLQKQNKRDPRDSFKLLQKQNKRDPRDSFKLLQN